MKIKKIRCTTGADGQASWQSFEVDSADLTADEFAQVRILIESCGLLLDRRERARPENARDVISVSVETGDGEHLSCYLCEELPDEVAELVELIKSKHRQQDIFTKSLPL